MPLLDQRMSRFCAELKTEQVQALEDCNLTHQDIADLVKVNVSRVSRTFSYSIEYPLPGWWLSVLPNSLSMRLGRFLFAPQNADVVRRIPLLKSINHSLQDECLDFPCDIAGFIEASRKRGVSKHELQKSLDAVQETLTRARAEVETMP